MQLEKPDSDSSERKEFELKVNQILLEEARLKQEVTLLKHHNKSLRRENTDAQIATNESIAMSKKYLKLLSMTTVSFFFFFFVFFFSYHLYH
jgi:hypothetical protein